jgi:two-component system, chemotaxis family, sensor kinase Cph1
MNNAPLGTCKTADLGLGDRLQSIGGLVAIDKRTQLICACSENIEEFIGARPEALLGNSWQVAFSADQLGSLFAPADTTAQELPLIQKAQFGHKAMLVATHSVGNITVAELEPCQPEPHQFTFADRVGFLQRLAATDSAETAARLLMESIAATTGHDRVMLYKFLPDWHGEVITECLKPGVGGYLGLRFPAADLPANARRLYLVNWQRVIADVRADTVELLRVPGCTPINLSFSQFRAVHPVHIQYLKNIGVEASFSVSIIVAGKLWGLVACHHLTAKAPSLNQRQLCEEMARTAGLHMTDMENFRVEQSRAAFREQLAAILGALRTQTADRRALVLQLGPIGKVFGAQGMLARLDNLEFHSGNVPDEISLRALRNSLQTNDRSSVTALQSINPILGQYPALIRFASGSLYIPLAGEDYLLLLRPEQVESVRWAGRPQSETGVAEEIAQLTPRASFQAWTQTVKGTADPWQEAEFEAAGNLRALLIEFAEKQQLEEMALQDPLTGLANRAMFEKALQEAIRQSIKDNMLTAVLMLDLDRFKAVNDTMGHAAGDALLIEVAGRLKGLMRARDTVARLGGDEFGIVACDIKQVEDASRTAERIIREIHRPFQIQDRSVEIGVSIGVSLCPQHAIEHDELLAGADLALYQAKGAGRNTFKSFTNEMLSNSDQRESLRQGLIDAMHDGALSLVYQPILNSRTKTLHSFESFARWQHPLKGSLTALDFLPLLEQCQLLPQFAEWGIRQVLQQGKLWMRMALPLVPVSVNLAARQFIGLDLVGLCSAFSRELEVGLEWLRFDIDETALQGDFVRIKAKITALSQLGVLVNIDHFGQGLVPLNKLSDVKINQLKISGRYFEWSKDKTRNDALIAIVHEIGRVLQVSIVACQIESEVMETRAIAAGIEYLQGYRMSRELTPDAAAEWLRNRVGSDTGLHPMQCQ